MCRSRRVQAITSFASGLDGIIVAKLRSYARGAWSVNIVYDFSRWGALRGGSSQNSDISLTATVATACRMSHQLLCHLSAHFRGCLHLHHICARSTRCSRHTSQSSAGPCCLTVYSPLPSIPGLIGRGAQGSKCTLKRQRWSRCRA